MVKGQASYISTLAEYVWYEWVKFHGTGQSFPDSKEWLGRNLGHTIETGPTMVCNVLQINDEVMYKVYVMALTLDEIQSPDEQKQHDECGLWCMEWWLWYF
jgi:hypothetical protein